MATGHFSNNYPTQSVSDFLKHPVLIQKSLQALTANQFIAESLFTGGYNAPGGAVSYQESASSYMDDTEDEDLAIAEGAEYPEVYMSDKQERANTRKYAIASWMTFEDVDRNQYGQLARATARMKNSMVRNLDGVTMNMLKNNSRIREHVASAAWDNPNTTTIVDDLLLGSEMVEDESSGIFYPADTVVLSTRAYNRWMLNKDIRELHKDLDKSERPEFSGSVGTLAGLNVLKSPHVPDDVAFVLAKGQLGGIADEVPLTVKPVERDEHRDRFWLRAKRLTVAFLTDPNAVVRISGIKT